MKGLTILTPLGCERPAHSSAVRQLMGLPAKAKLPAGGLNARTVQGWVLWAEPLAPLNPSGHKRSTHRLLAQCQECAQILSAGRTNQHVCKGKK